MILIIKTKDNELIVSLLFYIIYTIIQVRFTKHIRPHFLFY